MNDKLRYYLFGVVVTSIIWIGVLFILDSISNDAELQYIINADCDGLKIHIDAFDEGKGLFAYWTSESQETINFKITEKNAEISRNAFDSRKC